MDAPELTAAEMRAAWTASAREILIETAAKYHSVITQKDLATEVMSRSGVHTKRQRHYWLGEVLTQVAIDCAAQDEPLLSSLCVNAQGSVGAGYAATVSAARGSFEGDADDHAAHERLECHRHFDADLPANGGVRALTERLSASRSREDAGPVPQVPHGRALDRGLRLLRLRRPPHAQRYIPPWEPCSLAGSEAGPPGIPGALPGGRARRICSSCDRAAICWA
jgi:hypothetical protein